MAQRKTTRKRSSKSKKNNSWYTKTELIAAVVITLTILVGISIYFKARTGVLGAVVGAFFFQLFGILAYLFPIVTIILFICIYTGRYHGQAGRNLIYLAITFVVFSLIVGTWHWVDGMYSTNIQISKELALEQIGPGVFGATLAHGAIRLVGKIGVYVISTIILLLAFLSFINMSITEFMRRVGRGTKTAFHSTKSSLQQAREKALERKEERQLAFDDEEKMQKRALSDNPYDDVDVVKPKKPEKIQINDYTANFKATAKKNAKHEGHADAPAATSQARNAVDPIDALLETNTGENGADSSSDLHAEAADAQDGETIAAGAPNDAKNSHTPGRQMSIAEYDLDVEEETQVYVKPPIELLRMPDISNRNDNAHILDEAKVIEKTLSSFGIESEVVSIDKGPTVTCFELKPQSGIKVSRIVNLADDLSLALATSDIRIEAPIPGKPYVGIEVPNKSKDDVALREIIQSTEFQSETSNIPVALGKSISGKPIIANIAKMPHTLIAGATGSGKSVCINTIIMSILYKYDPADVRLMLIDPKVVELSVYEGIPHLLIPVVTDPKKASKALFQAVQEMERRFRLFSEHSVRDIKGYREKQNVDDDMENLPYYVIIIDELSDLMMVAAQDVETHICRLAQMARACGIHLIIATQRPSVDVITGTIKANIPSRISFQVSSSIDSRTILDMAGAEKLLGKGDMLYYPSNFSKPQRVQGAFVSDKEVSQVVEFLKGKNTVSYDETLIENIEKQSQQDQSSADAADLDSLMDEVIEFISHEETTSISGLQRRFRIGYSRAGRIVDDLENMGLVSPQDGSKPRNVLIDEDYVGNRGETDEYSE